jgi:hypothetical protein
VANHIVSQQKLKDTDLNGLMVTNLPFKKKIFLFCPFQCKREGREMIGMSLGKKK